MDGFESPVNRSFAAASTVTLFCLSHTPYSLPLYFLSLAPLVGMWRQQPHRFSLKRTILEAMAIGVAMCWMITGFVEPAIPTWGNVLRFSGCVVYSVQLIGIALAIRWTSNWRPIISAPVIASTAVLLEFTQALLGLTVQPNQYQGKGQGPWSPWHVLNSNTLESIERHGPVDLLIWPECCLTESYFDSAFENGTSNNRDELLLRTHLTLHDFVVKMLPLYRTNCLLGVTMIESGTVSKYGLQLPEITRFNCGCLVTKTAQIDCHEKIALVPMAEGLPNWLWMDTVRRWVLPFFELAAPLSAGRGEPNGGGLLCIGAFDRVAMGVSPASGPDPLRANWVVMLLPYLEQANLSQLMNNNLAMDDPLNRPLRTLELSTMKCPSDGFNAAHYERAQLAGTAGHTYARGNYAYNMGPNRPCFNFNTNCESGFNSDTNDIVATASRIWGSGIGGFNVSMRFSDFPEGLSNQVAVDEIRAGISPIDPRGTWALGMVGASITAAHPGGPNQPDFGDGLTSCGLMWLTIGQDAMVQMRMPCQTSAIPSNFAATARSQHTGVVNLLRLDGSVETVADSVEAGVWLDLHSRDNGVVDRLLRR